VRSEEVRKKAEAGKYEGRSLLVPFPSLPYLPHHPHLSSPLPLTLLQQMIRLQRTGMVGIVHLNLQGGMGNVEVVPEFF
jgi:hypothetical protein